MKKMYILIISLIMVIISACGQNIKREEFDLESPPDDWYRFVDPNYNIAFWLPENREAVVWDVKASDTNDATHYQPADEEIDTEIWISVVPPVDFQENYCFPLASECGDPPVETYIIQVGEISVNCARNNLGSSKWRHNCVVGPYSSLRFFPENIGGPISFLLGLYTTDDWEVQDASILRKMVASFVLEQPPETK